MDRRSRRVLTYSEPLDPAILDDPTIKYTTVILSRVSNISPIHSLSSSVSHEKFWLL